MSRLAAARHTSRAGSEVHRYDGLRDAQAWQSAGRTGMAVGGTHGYGGRRDAPAREIKKQPRRSGAVFYIQSASAFSSARVKSSSCRPSASASSGARASVSCTGCLLLWRSLPRKKWQPALLAARKKRA